MAAPKTDLNRDPTKVELALMDAHRDVSRLESEKWGLTWTNAVLWNVIAALVPPSES